MMMFFLLALGADPVTIQFDRAIFSAFVTVAIFFAAHVIVAIKWGAKITSLVNSLMEKVNEITKELHGVREAVARLPITDARVEALRDDMRNLTATVKDQDGTLKQHSNNISALMVEAKLISRRVGDGS